MTFSQGVVVHADESCLGNGREGRNPGGSAALLEVRTPDGIVRSDLYLSSPDTTNNRMALAGAIATFEALSQKGRDVRVAFVSDSQYLIRGITEWVPSWRARGWRRKRGKIENLELWQTLVEVTDAHKPEWRWVRGHAGHPKNEYVNDLAIEAASSQSASHGVVASRFEDWLAAKHARGQFRSYDPDAALEDLAVDVWGAA